ncbi:MAG: hypothetical protein AAFV53_11325 [Myxococcota bacterium]
MADVQTLAARVEEIHTRYRQNFAGQSRITRDLNLLHQLIASMEGIAQDGGTIDGAGDSLLPTVRERLDLYRKERDAIAAAQAGGPAEVLAHRISEWTWLNQQRYQRNFAGQDRRTRDLGMLQEMRDEQRRWRDRLARAGTDQATGWRSDLLNQLEQSGNLYGSEFDAIQQARSTVTNDRKVSLLASLANGQFALWREHFANKARLSRRAGLLRRMLAQLKIIQGDMQAVRDAGITTDVHQKNLATVTERIATWQRELTEIERAAGSAGPDQVAGNLAREANEQFAMYRENFAGRPYSEVDIETLHGICERLHEIARNMDTLDQTWGREGNSKNLNVVIENLKRYEREWSRIRDARKNT